ncbi:MAG: aminomethyl-transferring glycine dehydrogenase subunit GcvPB [bacterium JZ-2024 1]
MPTYPREPLIFQKSRPGRIAYSLSRGSFPDCPLDDLIPATLKRESPPHLPSLSELDVIRHFLRLSHLNWGVDIGFYPLGSCTMKYNPKVNEVVASLPGFAWVHPCQSEETIQGILEALWELERDLCEIFGTDHFILQPAAGAHGELTGLLLMRAYHQANGELQRNEIIVPDSAHGTNPASAAMVGWRVVEVPSSEQGLISASTLRQYLSEKTAGLMMTNPNTLGLFESDVREIAELTHAAGGLLYYDGANGNAILGYARPGDMGFDIVHVNVHKTFSTPHGGGGPGAGPVGVKKLLAPFLPVPRLIKKGKRFAWDYNVPQSIGKVKCFWGHIAVLLRAATYIREMGPDGLKRVAQLAVLNANYLMKRIAEEFPAGFRAICKHEFVATGEPLHRVTGVRTMDVAKRLIDYGFHPPTIYFPHTVKEALMIEPTETESKETLDAFAEALLKIAQEARTNPDLVKSAPHRAPIGRPDEVRAARQPDLADTTS